MTADHDTAVGRLRARMAVDLTAAMRDRDRVRVAALRSLMAALDNAGAVPSDARAWPPAVGLGVAEAPRRELDQHGVHAIVTEEIHTREVAAGEYREVSRPDAAARIEAEAEALRPYLDGG
jgi:uncharacterized protein YqeY